MQKIIVNHDNVAEVISLINKTMFGRVYWSGLAFGRLESVDDCPALNWFSGTGTFERKFTATASLTDKIFLKDKAVRIDYDHKGIVVVPENSFYDLGFNPELMIIGNDVLIFEKDNENIGPEGGTSVYMECTPERKSFYVNKFG